VLCQPNPPFPEDDPRIIEIITSQEGWPESQKAEYRKQDALCSACHSQFDAYGLALEGFDAVGRARATDLDGNPVSSATRLPALLGERSVANAAEMASVIAESGLFERCMAMRVTNYALADESQGSVSTFPPDAPMNSCAVDEIVHAFEASGEPSFTRLAVEIVRSRTFRLRRGAP